MEPCLVHQEVLSRSNDEAKPLADQEFYELRIEESDDIWRPGFVLKQIHAAWDEAAQKVMWADPESERWPTLHKAQERCAARRDTLRAQGFDYSDLELL